MKNKVLCGGQVWKINVYCILTKVWFEKKEDFTMPCLELNQFYYNALFGAKSVFSFSFQLCIITMFNLPFPFFSLLKQKKENGKRRKDDQVSRKNKDKKVCYLIEAPGSGPFFSKYLRKRVSSFCLWNECSLLQYTSIHRHLSHGTMTLLMRF